jgi:hypothetical protein
VSEAVVALMDWLDKLKAAARQFAAKECDDTLTELKVAAFGHARWTKELIKARKREGRA